MLTQKKKEIYVFFHIPLTFTSLVHCYTKLLMELSDAQYNLQCQCLQFTIIYP